MIFDYTLAKREKKNKIVLFLSLPYYLGIEIIKPVFLFFSVFRFKKAKRIRSHSAFGGYFVIPLNYMSAKNSYSTQLVEYNLSKVVLTNWFELTDINNLNVPTNDSVEFHLFQKTDNYYSAFEINDGNLNIRKNISGGKFIPFLNIEGIRINANYDGFHFIRISFSLEPYFKKWKSEDFFVELKNRVGHELQEVTTQFEKNSKICSIVIVFDTRLNQVETRLDIGTLIEYSSNKLFDAIKQTEVSLSNTLGYKVLIPYFLKTAIFQYLAYFDEYIIRTKGIKLNFKISKIEDGVLMRILPTENVGIGEIKEWFTQYVNLAKQIEDFPKLIGLDSNVENNNNLDSIVKLELDFLRKKIELYENERMKLSGTNLNSNALYFSQKVDLNKPVAKELKISISNGFTDSVIKKLLKMNFPVEISNEIILLSNRLEKINARERKGILDHKDERIELNTINNALLSVIDKITELNAWNNAHNAHTS